MPESTLSIPVLPDPAGLNDLQIRFCWLHVFEPRQNHAYTAAKEDLGLDPSGNEASDAVLGCRMMDKPEVAAYFEGLKQAAAAFFPGGEIPVWLAHWGGYPREEQRFRSPQHLRDAVEPYFRERDEGGVKYGKPMIRSELCSDVLGISEALLRDSYGTKPGFAEVVEWINTRCAAWWARQMAEKPKEFALAGNTMQNRNRSYERQFDEVRALASAKYAEGGGNVPVVIQVTLETGGKVKKIESAVVPPPALPEANGHGTRQ